jgi:small subunit ribosomal protein S9
MSTPKSPITGRRKNAIARVRLADGSGNITINGRQFEEYFPTSALQSLLLVPLTLTGTRQTVDIAARANGGGLSGQMGAVRLGIARALIAENPEHRAVLKKAGLLTRDSRMKERKKPGRPGARKRFQFSKR